MSRLTYTVSTNTTPLSGTTVCIDSSPNGKQKDPLTTNPNMTASTMTLESEASMDEMNTEVYVEASKKQASSCGKEKQNDKYGDRGRIQPRLSLLPKKRKFPERDMMKSTFTLHEGEIVETKKDHGLKT